MGTRLFGGSGLNRWGNRRWEQAEAVTPKAGRVAPTSYPPPCEREETTASSAHRRTGAKAAKAAPHRLVPVRPYRRPGVLMPWAQHPSLEWMVSRPGWEPAYKDWSCSRPGCRPSWRHQRPGPYRTARPDAAAPGFLFPARPSRPRRSGVPQAVPFLHTVEAALRGRGVYLMTEPSPRKPSAPGFIPGVPGISAVAPAALEPGHSVVMLPARGTTDGGMKTPVAGAEG
jgi:hypothetical protein